MEISKEINTILERLKEKKADLEEKMSQDRKTKNDLLETQSELEQQLVNLNVSLEASQSSLNDLINTIDETERGYRKIVEAGETLMAIISQSLPKMENTL